MRVGLSRVLSFLGDELGAGPWTSGFQLDWVGEMGYEGLRWGWDQEGDCGGAWRCLTV